MAVRLNVANNAQTTLTAAITSTDTTFGVANASLFPSPPFRITIDAEIMEVGAVDTVANTFSSVLRAQEGTTAVTHNQGSYVENRFTKGTYDELASSIAEAFQSASDGKNDVASGITGMGQTASGSDTYATLKAKILAISTDATATAPDVLVGKSVYVGGKKVSGTMTNYGGQTLSYSPNAGGYAVRVSDSDPGNRINIRISNPNVGKIAADTNLDVEVWGVSPGLVKAGQKIGDWNSGVVGTFTSDGSTDASRLLAGTRMYGNGNAIDGTMPNRNSEYVADTWLQYTPPGGNPRVYAKPPKGYYAGGSSWSSQYNCWVEEPNLVSGNIRAGSSIFGVSGKNSVTDTADGSTDASRLLTGTRMYGNGSAIDGTMPNRSAENWNMPPVNISNDGAGTLHYQPPNGYYNGSSWVSHYDANFVPSNLRDGVSAMGMTGTLKPGDVFLAKGTMSAPIDGSSILTVTVTGLSSKPFQIGFRSQINSGTYAGQFDFMDIGSTTTLGAGGVTHRYFYAYYQGSVQSVVYNADGFTVKIYAQSASNVNATVNWYALHV